MPKWNTKRRSMKRFVIKEISGVTRPAQGGARMVIMKAAEDEDAEFCKASFAQALDDRMMDQRFCRAFGDAFDGIWERNDAFREALKDGYQNSEETVRQYVESIAEVARRAAEAVQGLAKSKDADSVIEKAVGDAVDAFMEAHEQENIPMTILTRAALKAAIAKFAKDGGTDATITEIKIAAGVLKAEDELPAEGALAKSASTDDGVVASLQKQVKVLSLSDDFKKHYETLATDQQDAFLALDATAQKAAVEGANSDDPVVYKTADGIEIRKSDGVTALMMAKRFDSLEKRFDKLESDTSGDRFTKTAEADYPHLPTEGTVEILKAAEGMTDADKKKKMLEGLAAANKALGKNFQRIGGNGNSVRKGANAGTSENEGAGSELESLAKAYAEENKVPFHKAYDAVLGTEKGAELYAEYVSGAADAADAD